MMTQIRLAVAQADLKSMFATFIRYIISGRKSFRSATICTDRGVSYRNYLGTCIVVWEPMMNTAHGYVILGKQRKRRVTFGIIDTRSKCGLGPAFSEKSKLT